MKQETENKQNRSDERRSASWDINNAFGNYFVMLISQGGLAFFSFFITIILVKNLGVEDYGQIAVFISARQFSQVFLWWTLNAMARFGVEEFVETNLISESFWNRAIILAVNLIIFIGSSVLWLPVVIITFKLPKEATIQFLLYLIISSIAMHFVFALQAMKMMKQQAFLQMLEKLINLIFVLGLLFIGILSWQKTLWVLGFHEFC